MTGVYSQLFLDNFGNLPPIVRALAAAADEMETKLERLRVHVGFHEDWSPSYDRTVKSAAANAHDVSWKTRCGVIDGMGSLPAFIQEMCGWMDVMGEKLEEVTAGIDKGEGEAITDKPSAIVTCTKCGKSLNPKGAHFHTRNCKGLAA